jgi:hypothetical protein
MSVYLYISGKVILGGKSQHVTFVQQHSHGILSLQGVHTVRFCCLNIECNNSLIVILIQATEQAPAPL